jgi:hypothetical protein
MAERQWSRVSLLKWAKRLKISVPPGTSDQQLYNMVMSAPATDRQILTLADILRPLKREVPQGLTFGRAIQAIDAANDLLNTQALEAMGMAEGEVWGVRDQYILVLRVYGSAYAHKISAQPVVLDREQGADKATPVPVGDQLTYHPHKLYLLWTKIDLTTWRP